MDNYDNVYESQQYAQYAPDVVSHEGGAISFQAIKQAGTKFVNTASNVIKNADVYAARATDAINRGAQMVNTTSQQMQQAVGNVSNAVGNVSNAVNTTVNTAHAQYNQVGQQLQQQGQQMRQQMQQGLQVQPMVGRDDNVWISNNWTWNQMAPKTRLILTVIAVAIVLIVIVIVFMALRKSNFTDGGVRECIADAAARKNSYYGRR